MMIKDLLSALVSYVLVTGILVIAYQFKDQSTAASEALAILQDSVTLPQSVIESRESITFILGEDKKDNNQYYHQASKYYALNPEGRTEYIVNSCRSLQEVNEYLKQHQPSNNQPWGLINLVSHGNQWLGLSARVTPKGKRATSERILEAIKNGELIPLTADVIDQDSEIFLHGCGLGNNHAVIPAVAQVFGQEDNLPVVRASRMFEYYTSLSGRSSNSLPERYLAKAFPVSYKMGYEPERQQLIATLEKTYPETPVDWNAALSRTSPRWPGDAYHITFEVPVKWVIPIENEEEMPHLKNKSEQMTWIINQQEITDRLAGMELPADKFNWWFRKVYVKNEAGEKQPAVWLKGYCTILTVLEAMTEKTDQNIHSPFRPEEDNRKYYTSNRQSEVRKTADWLAGCETI